MPKLTPAAAAEKQVRNLKASVEQIKAGVSAVTESPMEKAAAQQEKMLAKLTAAVTEGKWAAGLRRVTLAQWKDAFLKKGVNRIGQGAEAAKPKLTAFYGEFFPFLQTVQDECKAMTNISIEDAVAIASHNIRRIAEFKRTT